MVCCCTRNEHVSIHQHLTQRVNQMKNIKLGLTLAAFGFVCPGLASAAVISTNLDVTARVQAACDSISTTPVNFGLYSNAITNADGAVSLNCLEGTPYAIGLHGGSNFDVVSQRARMTSLTATGVVSYRLYKDAARTDLWGKCNSLICLEPTVVKATGSGAIQTFTVFGQAFAPDIFNPAPQPGIFSDVVLVEVSF